VIEGSTEYAWARLCARYGQRLDEAQWHRIESTRTLAGFFESVRGSSLQGWIGELAPASGAHVVDLHIRAQWRALVDELARWSAAEWQPAVRWCSALVDLPVVDYLARGGAPLPWMPDDPRYAALVEGERPRDHPLAPLLAAGSTVPAWTREWRRRLPRSRSGLLFELERMVVVHRAAFESLPPGDGTPARRSLAAKLVPLFRRAAATPVAVLVFLALALLDAERLRGELLRRAAFARARDAA
jgi:hypothetical protein